MEMRPRMLIALLAVLALMSGLASAQGRAEGSIAGQVQDGTGAILPGVTVVAANEATGFTREAVADAEGNFRLPALPPGSYVVTATLTGFSTFKRTVVVSVGSETRLTIPLAVGSIQESVTITGEAPLVDTSRTEQASTIAESEVRALPTNSRDFLEFALLSPGVVRGRTSGAGWGGDAGFSASGNRGDQNGINIDGLVNKTMDTGEEIGNFSQEAVQEFQVVTQSAPAEYGGAAGGTINAVTKSGTNQLSGYGFMFLRHNAFDKPAFNCCETGTDGVRTAVPEDEADEFQRLITGIAIGGPIRKDKAFFYAVFDRTSNNEPRIRTIRQTTIDTVRRIALPNIADDESNRVTQFKPTSTKGSIKVDYTLSRKHNASVRYSFADNFSPAGTASGQTSIDVSSESKNRFNLASASLTSFLSEKTLNTLRFQYNDDNNEVSWPHRGGLENITNWDAGLLISGGTGGTFGGGSSGSLNKHTWETKWELQDTVTVYRDNHQMKFGGQLMIVQFFQNYMFYTLGEWRFSDLNAFVAGRPNSFIQGFGPAAAYITPKVMSGFVQDEWQPSNNLTINYGIRYEYHKFPADVTNFDLREAVIDPQTGKYDVSSNGSSLMGGFENDTNNIAPRVGLSWAINDKTVLRAGGGMYYGSTYYGEMTQGMSWSSDRYRRYDFTSVDAAALWAQLRDPKSAIYNNGELRLATPPAGKLYSNIAHNTDLNTPQSTQLSVGLERQLTGNIAAQVTGLWSRGRNNIRAMHVNPQAAVFYPAGSRLPSNVTTPFDVDYRGGTRPDTTRENLIQYEMNGRMSYKGLSASLTGRFSGLNVRLMYSYNDTWDDATAITSRNTPSETDYPNGEWSKSVLSTTHSFRGSAVYETPKTWGAFARDWQLSTIVNIEGGHPFQVQAGFDFNNDTVTTDRPIGVPRNALWTDGYKNVDMRVARFIPLGGRMKAEVIFEIFNLLNAKHYSNYIDTLYVSAGGGRYNPRPDFAGFAASADLNQRDFDRVPGDIGLSAAQRRNGVADPFQGQLAIRLRF